MYAYVGTNSSIVFFTLTFFAFYLHSSVRSNFLRFTCIHVLRKMLDDDLFFKYLGGESFSKSSSSLSLEIFISSPVFDENFYILPSCSKLVNVCIPNCFLYIPFCLCRNSLRLGFAKYFTLQPFSNYLGLWEWKQL